MKRRIPSGTSLWLGAILCLLVASSASAESVLNGGFESGTFSNWTVSDTSGFSNIGPDPLFAHSGTFHANLGARGVTGSLSQNITTTPGGQYTLSFWLANDSGAVPNAFDVFWNGASVLSLANAPVSSYTFYSFNVAATGSSTSLQFLYRNDDDFFRLDDVSVVPEPSTLLFLFPCAAGLWGAHRCLGKRRA